jgi:hypothetical protein
MATWFQDTVAVTGEKLRSEKKTTEAVHTIRVVYSVWCVCSLGYPECKLHAPYYIVVCGLSGFHHIFPHLIKGTVFRKEVFEHKMCVLIFSTTFI